MRLNDERSIFTNGLLLMFISVWWIASLPRIKYVMVVLVIVILLDCTTIFHRHSKQLYWIKLGGIMIFGVGLRLGGIFQNLKNVGDFITVPLQAASYILRGINPYNTTLTIGGELKYPPLSLILYIPSAITGTDPRFMLLVFDMSSIILIAYCFRYDRDLQLLITAFYSTNLYSYQMLQVGWNDVIFGFFILAAFLSSRSPNTKWLSALALGCSLASKQFAIFFFPFLFFKYNLRDKLIALGTFFVFLAPFLFPNPRDLISSILGFAANQELSYFNGSKSLLLPLVDVIPGIAPYAAILSLLIPLGLAAYLLPKTLDFKQAVFHALLVFVIFLIIAPYSAYNYFYGAFIVLPLLIPAKVKLFDQTSQRVQ